MADTAPKSKSKRINVGTTLALVVTIVVFGLWRVAAIYDAHAGAPGWLWLVFESGMMLATLPFLALLFVLFGALLVHKGSGARSQSVIGGAVIGFLYALPLLLIGILGVEEAGPLSIAPVSLGMMMFAGAMGGYVGHAGWFPRDQATEDDAA